MAPAPTTVKAGGAISSGASSTLYSRTTNAGASTCLRTSSQVYAHFAEPGVWAAYPDVAAGLAGLRADGYRLGVVSNFDRRLRRVLTDLGLGESFEHIIISSEVGVDKPDPRIFQHALERFGVAAENVLHVGDDPRKDWGAEAAGLRVFRLERPRHTLADVRTAVALPASA